MGFFAELAEKMAMAGKTRSAALPEVAYQFHAERLGVRYLGVYEKHRVALFQDPVTGSSFAIREGETVETGIQRVRERFGLSW